MSEKQPEALRLAALFELNASLLDVAPDDYFWKTADELRRQRALLLAKHALLEEMAGALKALRSVEFDHSEEDICEVRQQAEAVHDGRDEDCPKLRAALLAHIERGRVPEGWRDDVHLAAQMLTWGHSDGEGMTARQEDEVRQHQKKLFAMLAAAPAAPDHSATVPECMVPPLGWRCTRGAGHAGPCAAVEYPDDVRLVEKGMQRLRATVPAEVPMPKPVAFGVLNTALTGSPHRLMMVRIDIPSDDQHGGALWMPLVFAEDAQKYGDAREAAGYAHILNWAVGRWKDEVQNRPLENRNRRPLDDAWRQVVRRVGGDPDELLGPSHDALLAAQKGGE